MGRLNASINHILHHDLVGLVASLLVPWLSTTFVAVVVLSWFIAFCLATSGHEAFVSVLQQRMVGGSLCEAAGTVLNPCSASDCVLGSYACYCSESLGCVVTCMVGVAVIRVPACRFVTRSQSMPTVALAEGTGTPFVNLNHRLHEDSMRS
jgi:hypothetical protein